MKIKITAYIPVKQEDRPILGKIYEVTKTKVIESTKTKLLFVDVNGTEVGVYEDRECEVVEA